MTATLQMSVRRIIPYWLASACLTENSSGNLQKSLSLFALEAQAEERLVDVLRQVFPGGAEGSFHMLPSCPL
jgi:hypothetical protein